MPLISVIITVYNGEQYLTECLDGIIAQTLKDIEIICVDDASTDSTPQILKKYQDKITVITNEENRMAGESRNIGFSKAVGEYVIFLDADDMFEPDMLCKAYEKARACEADICIFKEDLFSESMEKRVDYAYAEMTMRELGEKAFFSPREVADSLFGLWNGWAWDKLFRRRFIIQTGLQFQKLRSTNDGFFVHAAMASAKKITLLNEVLVHHRTGSSGSISNRRDGSWESCLMYLKALQKFLLENGLFLTYERSYLNWTLDFLYWNYQTLRKENREKLADSIRRFFFGELDIHKYGPEDFYNEFYSWLAERFCLQEEKQIPVVEAERCKKTYRLNGRKIMTLQKYIREQGWDMALWGAGIRGRAFVEEYGASMNVVCVYDMDQSRQGEKLCDEIIIRDPVMERPKGPTCILVLNSAHLRSAFHVLRGEMTVVFDMHTYLNSPGRMKDCLISCESL